MTIPLIAYSYCILYVCIQQGNDTGPTVTFCHVLGQEMGPDRHGQVLGFCVESEAPLLRPSTVLSPNITVGGPLLVTESSRLASSLSCMVTLKHLPNA